MFNKEIYIIAEVGSNHLGNKKIAKKSLFQAKRAGADCVKFQLFDENNLVSKNLKTYKHVQDKKIKYQHERFKKVKISLEYLKTLSNLAKKVGIDFSVTPFDPSYVQSIKKYVKFFKVASGDINNIPLLTEIRKTKKTVVVSTGMATAAEIKRISNFFPKNKLVLLHCISSYPTDPNDANLINIRHLKKYNVETGYSDHTPGIDVATKSVFFGAQVLEKHFLPINSKRAGDYSLSINEKNFKIMVKKIKQNLNIIGTVREKEYPCEKYFKKTLRRSLYFSKNLKKNYKLKYLDISFLRPYNKSGVDLKDYSKFVGRKLKSNVKKNQLIIKNNFKK